MLSNFFCKSHYIHVYHSNLFVNCLICKNEALEETLSDYGFM